MKCLALIKVTQFLSKLKAGFVYNKTTSFLAHFSICIVQIRADI